MAEVASIADAEIARLLDAGDIEGAALLAAKLPKPAAFLAAMIEVNRIVSNGMKGKRMIAMIEQAAKLTKFTPYVELHGKDPEPGSALRLEFNVASSFLAGFNDELRALLFHKLGARSHDLADQTAELPDLRFEKIKPPYLWRQKYDDSTLTIHIGDRANNAIVLAGKIKKPFSITPMQGGTVVVAMTFNCHPDAKDVGKIYSLQRQDVRISLDPGTEVDDSGGEEEEGSEEE